MTSSSPTVYVCVGKDCRRDKGHQELRSAVEAVACVKTVDCQKFCKGPVVGTRVDGHLEWFGNLRKASDRTAIVQLLRSKRDDLPERLKARRAKRRRDLLRT